MPFFDASGGFPQPTLKVTGPRSFRLETGFEYTLPERLPESDTVTASVPAMDTDLASIPGPLWGFIGPYGKQTLPVLLHDTLCDVARAAPPADQLQLRRYADDVLFVSLQDQDSGNRSVSIPRSRVFWAGVTLGRYWEHSKPKLVGVLALLLAATAALYAIPVLVQVALDRWWLTILVWLAAIALAQIVAAATTSTRLVFMLLVGAAVVVPVVTIALLTVATTLTLNLLPWAVLKVLPGIESGAPPELGPSTVGAASKPARRRS